MWTIQRNCEQCRHWANGICTLTGVKVAGFTPMCEKGDRKYGFEIKREYVEGFKNILSQNIQTSIFQLVR